MKSKFVCRGLISLYVNFHNNRTMWSTNFYVKTCRWGEKEKEPTRLFVNICVKTLFTQNTPISFFQI